MGCNRTQCSTKGHAVAITIANFTGLISFLFVLIYAHRAAMAAAAGGRVQQAWGRGRARRQQAGARRGRERARGKGRRAGPAQGVGQA